MTTLSNLEIGQRFSFPRKSCTFIYFGYLDGEFHFAFPHSEGCNVNEVETTATDFKVKIKEFKPNEIILAKWKAKGYKLN